MPDLDLDKAPVAGRGVDGVPVIDIGDLVAGGRGPELASIRAIADAAAGWGFFQVVNHGIDPGQIEQVWAETQEFFAQPISAKESILRNRENPWGYYNNELTKNQRDRKEVFDYSDDGRDPVYESENRWPAHSDTFRSVLSDYRDETASLSLTLLEGMCAGLGLSPDFLNKHFTPQHTGFTRLNYYPVDDPLAERADVTQLPEADLGIHHHTDAGALTVLLQDDVGGLQVYNEGLWYDVPAVDGALVINTGDMMQVWSNDRYRAAMHRVLASSASERYSIPFFYNPMAGTQVEPLPSVVTAEQPPNYRPIDWSDFRSKRTDGDYADYGPEVQISQYRIAS